MNFLIDRVRNTSELPTKDGFYTFLNPYSYLIARKQKSTFEGFDGIYIDGQLLAKFLSAVLNGNISRASFDMTSLAPKLFERAQETGESIYLIGAKTDQIESAVSSILVNYPRINLAGFRDGYFSSSEERRDAILKIRNISPTYVIVGMGTPIQEEFLLDLRASGWSGQAFTCGGFFHQTSERLHYYPKWINKLHLRAPYRAFKEPKLLRRYLLNYPLFLFAFINDWITITPESKKSKNGTT